MEEIWKSYIKYGKDRNGVISCIVTDIEISNFGNIRGKIYRHKPFTEDLIKINKSGHRCVGGNEIYGLMWELFVGEKPKGYDIHHEDGNPLNDRIDNLKCIPHKLHMSIHHKNKIVTNETKYKMSKWQKGVSKTWQIGVHWYNDGNSNKRFKNDVEAFAYGYFFKGILKNK